MTTQRLSDWGMSSIVCATAVLFSCANPDAPPAQISETTEAIEMSPITHIHHSIDYIEFTITDMEASKRFYAAAFGWAFNDYGPDYAGIQKEGGEAGGFRLDSQASTGGPLVILFSEDLEATLKSVQEAGGRITTEPFSFPGGRRFHFQDPSGNELAVWSEN